MAVFIVESGGGGKKWGSIVGINLIFNPANAYVADATSTSDQTNVWLARQFWARVLFSVSRFESYFEQ